MSRIDSGAKEVVILLLDSCSAGNGHSIPDSTNGFDAPCDRLKGVRDATDRIVDTGGPVERKNDVIDPGGYDLCFLPEEKSRCEERDSNVQVAEEAGECGELAVEERLAA